MSYAREKRKKTMHRLLHFIRACSSRCFFLRGGKRMTLTNKKGLPHGFVAACSTEQHNKAWELSATTLLKGVKEIILTDDDVMLLLKLIFHRQDTQELLKKLLEREKPETP